MIREPLTALKKETPNITYRDGIGQFKLVFSTRFEGYGSSKQTTVEGRKYSEQHRKFESLVLRQK